MRRDRPGGRVGAARGRRLPLSDEVVRKRFAAQLLAHERAPDADAVAERLLAVQAQDLRSARLAIRARTAGLAASDVDRALDERSLVIGWLNRGTLHLVRPEDYWWLHSLTTPPLLTGNARRLRQTGVTPAASERGVEAIERALAAGPLTRDELRDVVAARRVPTAGQALVHLLMLACLRGVALRGPFLNGRHAYVLAHDWLGPPPPVDRDVALAELARRYVAGHAPAGDRDLAKWAGLPLRDARVALQRIAGDLVERRDGLLEPNGRRPVGRLRPCLLDQWDPVLVGWSSRDPLLEHYPRRATAEAHFRPFAWVGGRAVATWSLGGGTVRIDSPFIPLPEPAAHALRREAADVTRYLGR